MTEPVIVKTDFVGVDRYGHLTVDPAEAIEGEAFVTWSDGTTEHVVLVANHESAA